MKLVAGSDFGDAIGHAGAAGDAIDDAFGAVKDAMQNALRCRHFPKNIHMNAASAAAKLMRFLRLRDAALDGIRDQLFMPVAARFSFVNLRNEITLRVVTVGV